MFEYSSSFSLFICAALHLLGCRVLFQILCVKVLYINKVLSFGLCTKSRNRACRCGANGNATFYFPSCDYCISQSALEACAPFKGLLLEACTCRTNEFHWTDQNCLGPTVVHPATHQCPWPNFMASDQSLVQPWLVFHTVVFSVYTKFKIFFVCS